MPPQPSVVSAPAKVVYHRAQPIGSGGPRPPPEVFYANDPRLGELASSLDPEAKSQLDNTLSRFCGQQPAVERPASPVKNGWTATSQLLDSWGRQPNDGYAASAPSQPNPSFPLSPCHRAERTMQADAIGCVARTAHFGQAGAALPTTPYTGPQRGFVTVPVPVARGTVLVQQPNAAAVWISNAWPDIAGAGSAWPGLLEWARTALLAPTVPSTEASRKQEGPQNSGKPGSSPANPVAKQSFGKREFLREKDEDSSDSDSEVEERPVAETIIEDESHCMACCTRPVSGRKGSKTVNFVGADGSVADPWGDSGKEADHRHSTKDMTAARR